MISCKRENTQVLLIDMQTRLMPAMAHRQSVLDRSVFFLKAMNILGIPVTVSEQYSRGLGHTEEILMEQIPEGTPLEKLTFGCMLQPDIAERVMNGPENVLILGVETHICVLQTVLELIESGKTVYLVCDCVDSRNSFDRDMAFRRMEQAGCRLTTSESMVYELMEQAGTAEFKQISALVKETPMFQDLK